MGAEPSPDVLGNTATDAAAATGRALTPMVPTIGRYRIERELGAGGMGVVYAAFDPDLERRVALKVITDGKTLDRDARTRLLSEARAMARLNHPNVVTVFEVGSAGGRDYVAMELVDGTTLADWLRTARPSRREIIAAFIAAGHGLAAAHEAGLIHRDFKPHNVLRRRDGGVQVTDFGLARDAGATLEPAASRDTPSPVGGSTETGSILGTPAYMAPEQWLGTAVGPPADQFAFCVALWEALAGERPFGATTRLDGTGTQLASPADDGSPPRPAGPVEDMRTAIMNRTLDASAIPRRLRDSLLRGLAPAPDLRWPSMAVLLRRLERVQRTRGVAIASASVAVIALAGAALLLARGDTTACRASLLDVDTVWSASTAASLATKQQAPTVRALDRDVRTWRALRDQACTGEPDQRGPKLTCLDGVMARIDEAARLADRIPIPHLDVSGWLQDPTMCARPNPPRLMTMVSPQLDEVLMRIYGEPANPEIFTRAVADRLIAHAATDPCAASMAHLDASSTSELVARNAELDEAANFADICDDDRLRFTVALTQASWEALDKQGDPKRVALKRVEANLQRDPDPSAMAEVDDLRLRQAHDANQLDAAVALGQRAMDEFRARDRILRMLDVGNELAALHQVQGRPDPLADTRMFDELSRVASAYLGADDEHVAQIDRSRAILLYSNGDIAAAHAISDRLRKPQHLARSRHLTGRVVDDHHQPVAGALVTSGCCLQGDALGAAITMGDGSGKLRTATTDANGRFDLPESLSKGTIVAELGTSRSRPSEIAEGVELVLEPTSRLEGHVELHGRAAFNAEVTATDRSKPATLSYETIAPVLADGSFVLAGIRHGDVAVTVTVSATTETITEKTIVHVAEPLVVGPTFDLPSTHRTVHVVVRSTIGESLPRVIVYVFAGRIASTTAAGVSAITGRANEVWAHSIEGERAPPGVLSRAQPGDLYATDFEAPAGEASACATAYAADLNDAQQNERIAAHLDKLAVPCVPLGSTDEVVVIEVPPFPRLDQ